MKNRYLCLMILLILQVMAVRGISYDYRSDKNEGLETVNKIPQHIDNWTGKDHPLDPSVYEILETRSILHRSYRNDMGQEVFLSIVYYNETKVDFHAPEACLGGQGTKTTKSHAQIKITGANEAPQDLKVNKLIQTGDTGNHTLVYYFYKTGPFIGRSYIGLRLNLILNKFRDARKSGSLIRVSTPMKKDFDHAQESVLLSQFVNQLYPFLIRYF